jgi:hypothetical protein
MKAFADKLIDILENHSEEIARQWSQAVSTSARTPSYHSLAKDKYVEHGVEFYRNLRTLYFSKPPYAEETKYFRRFADDMHAQKMPLHEVVYSLVLMRRHIWLFADFHVVFTTTLDMHQAVESINRTIQMFDHVIYSVIQRYGEIQAKA